MPYKKYIRKAVKKGVRFARKRYTTRTKGGVRVARIAKDLAMVKRQLNVEHKHIDYTFGSAGSAHALTQYPTKQTPIILPLNTPVRGTAYNNRVGNQIRIVHMTSKLEFIFQNNTDLIQRTNVRAQIVFSKNASDVPTIDELYEQDANGHYTPMSMTNTQEYKKFLWIKSQDHRKGYTQPTNRYPASNSDALVANPAYNATGNVNASAVSNVKLNSAQFYSNKQSKVSIKMMFKNGTEEVEMMKPYLLLRSDVIDASPNDYDPIAVSGIIRMTYVDN